MRATSIWAILLVFVSPTLASPECWDGQTVESLVEDSEWVAVGEVESVTFEGCVTDNGDVAACSDLEHGQSMQNRAYKIEFEAARWLKRSSESPQHFLIIVPAILFGCEGPGTQQGIETLVFIKTVNDRATAWGGDFALYQSTRWDFDKVLAEAESLSKPEGTRGDDARP